MGIWGISVFPHCNFILFILLVCVIGYFDADVLIESIGLQVNSSLI
jgi:hypothetical protein